MSRVAILMSTYNGDQYIQRQIQSIYDQTYQDFILYIRDDGSEPSFRRQLKELQKKYQFKLILGENKGFVGSFMELLDSVKDAELYSFADQDDIWFPEKIQRAVKWFDHLREDQKGKPCLFHSAYDIVDGSGNLIDRFYFRNKGYDFRRSITENHYSGFAMVINQSMRNLMLKGEWNRIGYHDWWAAMIAHGFGVGYSDKKVMAEHVSHGGNVTTFNVKTRMKWLMKSLNEESEIHRRCMEFKRCFGCRLSLENQKILADFTNTHYSITSALRKALYPKRWRPMFSSEIVMRILMLIGKI